MPRPKRRSAAHPTTASRQVNKAHLIRETAALLGGVTRPREIIAALAEKGVSVSSQQVSKTLTAAGYKRTPRGKEAPAAEVAVNGAVEASKASRIREAAAAFGRNVRLRDIIGKLAEEGIAVSSAQVSSTLRSMGYRHSRRSRRGKLAAGTREGAAKSAAAGLDIEALIAAKALISKVGSVARAEAALGVLKRLQ